MQSERDKISVKRSASQSVASIQIQNAAGIDVSLPDLSPDIDPAHAVTIAALLQAEACIKQVFLLFSNNLNFSSQLLSINQFGQENLFSNQVKKLIANAKTHVQILAMSIILHVFLIKC